MKTSADWSLKMTELVSRSLDDIRSTCDNRDVLRGLDTGFDDLNAMTAGLKPGTLTIIGGRPSMGKTVFALNILRHVSVELNNSAVFVAYEDSCEQLTQRMLAIGAKIDSNRLRTGHMTDSDWERVIVESKRLQGAPLVIDERALSISELHQTCREYIDSGEELKLLLVDCVQLMPLDEEGFGDKKISLARQLKKMAVDLNIVVIATSQISRAVESRKNKRPILSDLREGAVDGDAADLILFLYRDEYYNPDSTFRGEAEIMIAKQRYGPTGVIELLYQNGTGLFQNKHQWSCDTENGILCTISDEDHECDTYGSDSAC